MFTLESQIQKITGVVIRGIPTDGKVRKFKVNGKEWNAANFGDFAVFGSVRHDEVYGWSPMRNSGRCWRLEEVPQRRRMSAKEIATEREIIAIGNAMQDSGEQMDGEDLDRYILALTRVIEVDGGVLV